MTNDTQELRYQSGFGNQFASEAVPGTLPVGRNSPQKVARGLYAELLSGTAFTAPRAANLRTWLYRRRPSVLCGGYESLVQPHWKTGAKDGDLLRFKCLFTTKLIGLTVLSGKAQ